MDKKILDKIKQSNNDFELQLCIVERQISKLNTLNTIKNINQYKYQIDIQEYNKEYKLIKK